MQSIAPRNAAETPLWKPSSAVRSNWNGISWKEYARYTFTYDNEGRTITETAENLDKSQTQYYPVSQIVNTYDSQGRLTCTKVSAGMDAGHLEPYTITEITYDAILPEVVAEQNAYYILEDGSRELNDQSYKQIIERDEKGRVTAMHAFTWYEGDFIEAMTVETEYGSDGLPETVSEFVLGQATEGGPIELLPGEKYSRCKWLETDCQIISLDGITSGANRLSAAVVNTQQQPDINMSVEYPVDGEFDFISTSEYSYLTFIPTKTVTSHKDFGDKGYYTKIVTDQDLTAAGAYPVQSVTQVLCQYDDFGNLLEMQDQTFYGHTIINSWKKGDVESDPETGLPSSYLRKKYVLTDGSDYYGTWEDEYKIVYEGWNDVASVGLQLPDAGIEPEYYDMSGRRVRNPGAGIYIMKQGAKTEKLMIK